MTLAINMRSLNDRLKPQVEAHLEEYQKNNGPLTEKQKAVVRLAAYSLLLTARIKRAQFEQETQKLGAVICLN